MPVELVTFMYWNSPDTRISTYIFICALNLSLTLNAARHDWDILRILLEKLDDDETHLNFSLKSFALFQRLARHILQ
jgi:hypothetical protein